MYFLRTGSLVVTALMVMSPAFAWGPDGHKTVATLAAKLIVGSNAATQVHSLLGNLSLADVAVWADCAKGVNSSTFEYENAGRYPECRIFETADGEAAMVDFVRRNSSNCTIKTGEEVCHAQYHYADVAIQHQAYLPGFEGARDDDIVASVAAATHVLKGDPSPLPYNIKDKSEALRLLVHYVGDIHQPLHVGAIYLDPVGNAVNPDTGTFNPDTATRGGNNIKVKGAARANLHHTWDEIPNSMKLARVNASWVAKARAIPASTGADFDWPKQWATQSVSRADQALASLDYGPKSGTHWTVVLPARYAATMSSIKKEQLTRAGGRLAQLLQDIWP